MLNSKDLDLKYPNIAPTEPDTELIIFSSMLLEKNIVPSHIPLLIGMLKYILLHKKVDEYSKEFKLLIRIYNRL